MVEGPGHLSRVYDQVKVVKHPFYENVGGHCPQSPCFDAPVKCPLLVSLRRIDSLITFHIAKLDTVLTLKLRKFHTRQCQANYLRQWKVSV